MADSFTEVTSQSWGSRLMESIKGVPFLGSILGMGVSIFAGIISLALSFITISIAWVVYRPIIGIGLIVLGVGIFMGIKMLADKKRKSATGSPE